MSKKFLVVLSFSSWSLSGSQHDVTFFAEDRLFQERYTCIKKYLNQYSRSFTAIEINPSVDKPFCLPISHDYSCTCLMFGSTELHTIVKQCKKIKQGNLLIGWQEEPYKYFQRMTECEHFDVVIIPEVRLKKTGLNADLFELYTQLGDHTIIELLTFNNEQLAETLFIKEKKLELLGQVKHSNNTTMSNFYFSYNPRTFLLRRRWTSKHSERRFYHITATFDEKTFIKRESKGKPISWSSGINLLTFAKLKAVYPAKETIIDQIRTFSKVKHGDLALCNIIIQGKRLKLIDWESHKIHAPPEERVERIIAKLLKYLRSKRSCFFSFS